MKSGVILIDKQAGLSTTGEEANLKHILHTKKIGHAGTLDPFATGLILCGIEKGTKTLEFFENKDKTYIATLQLGKKTDSGDLDGVVVETKEPKDHQESEIQEVLNSFLGDSTQIPPMYSALKKDGVPLYKLARQGETVAREPRKIHIYSLSLLSYDSKKAEITFEVSVSKGTYIRTLGEDISAKLGEVGYLTALRRTKVGGFDVKDAYKAIDVKESNIIPIAALFPELKHITIDPTNEKRIRNGADITLNEPGNDVVLMLAENGEAMALYAKADNGYYKVLKEFI